MARESWRCRYWELFLQLVQGHLQWDGMPDANTWPSMQQRLCASTHTGVMGDFSSALDRRSDLRALFSRRRATHWRRCSVYAAQNLNYRSGLLAHIVALVPSHTQHCDPVLQRLTINSRLPKAPKAKRVSAGCGSKCCMKASSMWSHWVCLVPGSITDRLRRVGCRRGAWIRRTGDCRVDAVRCSGRLAAPELGSAGEAAPLKAEPSQGC